MLHQFRPGLVLLGRRLVEGTEDIGSHLEFANGRFILHLLDALHVLEVLIIFLNDPQKLFPLYFQDGSTLCYTSHARRQSTTSQNVFQAENLSLANNQYAQVAYGKLLNISGRV